ncbi:hypothetical protein ES705_40999 [subsurface metagenome]
MIGLLNTPNNKYRHLTDIEREDLRNKGEEVWKRYIREKILNCNAVLCLIGQNTHNATGVIYELEVCNSLGKKIVPVRIPKTKGGLPWVIGKLDIVNWNSEEINNELSKV